MYEIRGQSSCSTTGEPKLRITRLPRSRQCRVGDTDPKILNGNGKAGANLDLNFVNTFSNPDNNASPYFWSWGQIYLTGPRQMSDTAKLEVLDLAPNPIRKLESVLENRFYVELAYCGKQPSARRCYLSSYKNSRFEFCRVRSSLDFSIIAQLMVELPY